jgi:hypothetical protein
VCWSIVVKEKSAVGSPVSRTFPSDRTPKATKDVTVHFFTPVTIPVNSTSEFRELLKLLRIIIIVVLQLNFVYRVIKNLPFKNSSFRSLSPSLGKERKEVLRRVHQMKQSSSEDTAAAQRVTRTSTPTDRTVSKPCRLAQVCNGSNKTIGRIQWIRDTIIG